MERRGMRNKGLSPVIATVLLVGVVVVSGLIIFTWFRGLTQEAVTKFDQNIQLVCNDVKFEAEYSNVDDTLAISNTGNIPIFGFDIKESSESGSSTKSIDLLIGWPKGGLKQGGAALVDAGIDPSSEIKLVPVLRGTSQEGTEIPFTCDENAYGQIVSV